MKSAKWNSYFFNVIGVLFTLNLIHGGVLHEKDLDTLLLRSGVDFSNDNQRSTSVPKEIQDLVSSAPAVSLSSIPKRLQPIIQYALERPYPGSSLSRANNDKLKKTVVYLITSRLRPRGNSDDASQIDIENLNENPEQQQQQEQQQEQPQQQQQQQQYGAPSDSSSFPPQQNVIRTVLKESPQYKSTSSKTILQPKQGYNTPGASSGQRQQNFNAPAGRTVSSNQQQNYQIPAASGGILTIRPRPTPPSPDFEIIRTISSDAETLLAPRQNLRSAYRAALHFPQQSIQAESHHAPQYQAHPPPQYQAPIVNLVPAAAQTYQEDVDEGLSVLGGAEGLSALVAKIEGLGDSPQPHQLDLSQDVVAIQSSPPIPVPVPVVETNPHVVTVVETNNNIPQLHSQQNDYITYLNPPLVVESGQPLKEISGIHTAAAVLPRRFNKFFQNVLRSFRRNISNLRSLRPSVIYDNDPWPKTNYGSATKFQKISSPKQIQQPTLVSTTTYTSSSSQPVEHTNTHDTHVNVFPSVSFSAQGIQNH